MKRSNHGRSETHVTDIELTNCRCASAQHISAGWERLSPFHLGAALESFAASQGKGDVVSPACPFNLKVLGPGAFSGSAPYLWASDLRTTLGCLGQAVTEQGLLAA